MKATVIDRDWMTTDEAIEALGRSQRTIQKLAKRGEIQWKTQPNAAMGTSGRPIRLYRRDDVDRIAQFGAKTPEKPVLSTALVRKLKPTQGERALDMVSIVGNLVAGHKAEMEMLVGQMTRNLETVVTLILTAQKAEADANRERSKAEREDARERWELERQDRLDRRKNRGLALVSPPPPAPKVRKAHA